MHVKKHQLITMEYKRITTAFRDAQTTDVFLKQIDNINICSLHKDNEDDRSDHLHKVSLWLGPGTM